MFKLEFQNNEDIIKKYQEVVDNLKEDQKTDFIFNDENFYKIGGGHDFIFGFFTEYITKTGLIGRQYSGLWKIENKDYSLENSQFIEIIRESRNLTPFSVEDISNATKFPIIKNVPSKTLADGLFPITPLSPKYPNVD